jgi:hypothetical protein
MDFEKQYRVFVISFSLCIVFYIFGEAITSFTAVQDFILKVLMKGAVFLLIFLISLLFLGGLSFMDVHFIYAHLVTMIVFAAYGIFLTADNLSYMLTSKCLLCFLPFKIPAQILFLKTRYFIIIISIAIAVVWDILEIKETPKKFLRERLSKKLFRT